MRIVNRVALIGRIAWEILRYEIVFKLRGFAGIHAGLRRQIPVGDPDLGLASVICAAFDDASSFYWKQMVCLQRSVVAARVMHRYGIPAVVVIGCRFTPFVGHAWVEINGVVVNDSRGYPEKLMVMERIGPASSAA